MDIEEQYNKIYRFCYYKIHCKEEAEDLTQETFLRFFKSNYRDRGMEIRYLYTIARNLCIDEGRKVRPVLLSDEYMSDDFGSYLLDEHIRVKKALFELSGEEREILVMRYMNDVSMNDICSITGLSRFALYRKIGKIRKKFIEMLNEERTYE